MVMTILDSLKIVVAFSLESHFHFSKCDIAITLLLPTDNIEITSCAADGSNSPFVTHCTK